MRILSRTNDFTNPNSSSSAPREIRATLDIMENANGDDWREELYLKIRSIKEMCLPHLSDLYQTTEDKLQHQESLLPQQRSDEFEKLKRFKTTLERMIQLLSIPKSKIVPALKHKIAFYEKKIMDLMMMHRPRQLPQSQTIHGMQQNASSSKPGSRLEPGQGSGLSNGNGGDWQGQVFQKIQSMKEMYLAELNEIYQRVAIKVHQQNSIPQQQRSDEFEKLIQLKTMLERMMQFLSVPKTNIMPALKDKVAYYEKQIIGFLNMHRPRDTVQQPQLSQSQNIQDQFHDKQTNLKMKSMSMQASGPRAQESNQTYMQNNVLSSLPGVLAPQQNIPSFLLASSSESGQGNALNFGQQVLAMRSMLQNTSQQVNNSSASAQSGSWTLHSNVNQTQLSSILLQHQQPEDLLMQLKRQFQYRQMQQQELLQLQQQQQQMPQQMTQQLKQQFQYRQMQQQQQQMPQQMTQQLKQQFQYRQMQQQQLQQQVNQLQQHLQARQQDQQMRQQLQQHQMQQQQLLQQVNQLQQHLQARQQEQQMRQQLQQHQMQQRQQHQMQQQQPNMSSSIPASNLESGQGSGVNNANGSDLQEELFQKFKSMKETYLADLNELYQRVIARVQQQDSLPPQERSDNFEKQKEFKTVLEHIIRYLSVSRRTISPASKDMLDYIESQIILYLNAHRPAEQGQLPQT